VRWLRAQPDQQQLVRDSYYDDPLDASARRYRDGVEFAALRAWLPPHGEALELGAGRGIASYALASAGLRVVALEPDPSALVGAGAIAWLASATGAAIEPVVGVSENLPFADGRFDVVLARAVLHHTRDLDSSCREVARVLRPGGRFLAIREHVLSHPDDLSRFQSAHPLHRLYGGEYAYVLARYLAAIENAGLEVEHVLDPFASALNHAPRSLDDLRREIASRVLPGNAGAAIGSAFLRAGWPVARRLLASVDRRPGRLYSFIGRKPA